MEIFRLWDGVVVNDLGSKNGLRVNDVMVLDQRRLGDGDRLQIGPATLRLSDPADRYLREFEARAPEVPRTEDDSVPAPAAASPAASSAVADVPKVARAVPLATAAAVAPTKPAPTAASRRPGGSRTAMVVAAAVLMAIGAVIVALVFG